MQKTYDPNTIETNIYEQWQSLNCFAPSGEGIAYCIMLPPPNVTGTLHMGHGFQDTLMDLLTRYHRMQGNNTLWQPGTDHAGIATQMVVERQLAQDNKTRHDLGREAFEKRVWEWKGESGDSILKQMKRLGCSADWSRTRFTMDEGLSAAVRQAFVQLYDEGLIYRGKRLVNWDPALKTAVSDLEVINTDKQGSLWHIRYPLVGSDKFLVVATTRPETLLGDMAVAVHPEDERYKSLIGQQVQLPLTERTIPIIADDYVDPEFGTGCVKITPAHDFNDYQVGLRHNLEMMNILTDSAHLNELVPKAYQGLERFEARKKIVSNLEDANLIEKIEPHSHKVPFGERSGAVIEPYLTDQWYIKIEPLAAPARDAVKSGRIQLIPENAQNLYFEWMNNIQDWCISRQLWWGHRIPAWYDVDGNVYVGENEADVRRKHNLDDSIDLAQDEDVLDTWFSAGLWPFSTLGWPDKTPELNTFYPTSVLVTGFDIIFFWVCRMIMFGLKFMGDVPFKQVYLHGLIRDHDGQKMSKSKGNVLDPVDLIDGVDLKTLIEKRTKGLMLESHKDKVIKATEKQFPEGIAAYGTDALRFTYTALASRSRDINFDVKRLEGYRNFCNKLWNAARFVMMNVENETITASDAEMSFADCWILEKLNHTIASCHKAIEDYRFDQLAQTLYEFVWNDYCDWYLEFSKVTLNDDAASNAQKAATRHTLIAVLETICRLAHPVIPFITESIWQSIKTTAGVVGDTLMLQAYPTAISATNEPLLAEAEQLQELITKIRTARSELNLVPSKRIEALYVQAGKLDQAQIASHAKLIQFLTRCDSIEFTNTTPENATSITATAATVYIPLAGLIDLDAEKQRLQKELEKTEQEIARLQGKLNNKSFTDKAPEAVVTKEQEKLAAAEVIKAKLLDQLNSLGH